MKAELQKELHKNWSHILNEVGIECGDGWFDLINQLCVMLDNVIQNETQLTIKATQIKEKFGTLRFYYNISREYPYVDGIVAAFEHISSFICEECGHPGFLHKTKNGWFVTICQDCISKKPNAKDYQISEVKNYKYITIPYRKAVLKYKIKNM